MSRLCVCVTALVCLGGLVRAADEDVPKITFESGDYILTFDGGRFWTIWNLSYKGVQILSGVRGAHNGTVLSCKPEGWIGTGHGLEEVIEMSVKVKAKKRKFEPDETYKGKELLLTKKSSLRIYELLATVELTPDGVTEINKYTVKEERPINFIYGFMHSFAQNLSEWAAQPAEGEVLSGKFVDDKGNLLQKPIRWAALFDPEAKVGIVCRFPDKYVPQSTTFFWDREHDNKLYYQLKPKVGEAFECQVNLRAFECKKGEWSDEAKQVAGKL
ncbi:MAG: hypothetical protein AB1696_15640 [Planctomycetota bacterium]